jgi:hypothetical protein
MRLFPRAFDNDYRGQWAAIWLFLPVLAMKFLIGFNIGGLNPLVSNRQVLETADGIPLDSFGAQAAQTIVFFGASWGLNMVILCALAVIAFLRYRSMLPLVILLFAAEQIGRKAMSAHYFPAGEGAGTSIGAMINWGFTAALAFAVVLSLIPRRRNL